MHARVLLVIIATCFTVTSAAAISPHGCRSCEAGIGCDRGCCPPPTASFDSACYDQYWPTQHGNDDCCNGIGGDPCGNCDAPCCGGYGQTSCFDSETLGDPYSLFGNCGNFTIGGWAQLGYHSQNNILFNNRKNQYQLHQAWVYAEKAIDTSNGFDIGGRIDYVYGTDGPDTQAFGIDDDHWDNDWDNGSQENGYGHAIPQLYLEAGYGNLSAKVGHFFTIIGYEVVTAPDNFFYSHAYTMYNSEPFTHTGTLFTYRINEDVEMYAGWVLGWDSGFKDNGDAVLAGSRVQLTDDITVTSTGIYGRFGEDSDFGNYFGDERGIMHSTVATVTLCDDWEYVFQNDVLDTEDVNGNTVRDTVGINQYLMHTVCDRLAVGARMEWWQVSGDSRGFFDNNVLPGDYDIYALTLGSNIRPCANVVVRPEIRWDWVDGDLGELQAIGFPILEDNEDQQTTFGIDTIFLY